MTDWVGKWFQLLDDLGEFSGIRFGVRAPGEAEPRWEYLPHQEFDGIGALGHLLRARGLLPQGQSLPTINPQLRCSRLQGFWAMVKYLALPPPLPTWRRSSSVSFSPKAPLGPPQAITWRSFTVEETRTLRAAAASAGVSINSFLLHHFTRAVLPDLDLTRGPPVWMIPVNLRGAVHLASDTGNHASYLSVPVDPSGPELDTHEAVHRALREHAHWGAWHAINLGRFVGYRAMAWMKACDVAHGRGWTGVFSNLGEWKQVSPDALKGHEWIFCPAVSTYQPVGAGCVTLGGRLCIALQAHPSVTSESKTTEAWMKRWLDGLSVGNIITLVA